MGCTSTLRNDGEMKCKVEKRLIIYKWERGDIEGLCVGFKGDNY